MSYGFNTGRRPPESKLRKVARETALRRFPRLGRFDDTVATRWIDGFVLFGLILGIGFLVLWSARINAFGTPVVPIPPGAQAIYASWPAQLTKVLVLVGLVGLLVWKREDWLFAPGV